MSRMGIYFVVASCLPAFASAQTSGLQQPPETIKIQLSTANKDHKRQLSEYLEVPLAFPLVGRESVAIEAALGEPGRFDIEMLHTRGAVEVKNIRTEQGVGKAEVVRKTPPMSFDELRKRCDKRLEQLVGKDPKADVLRNKLNEAADANPRRFSVQDKKSWEAMKGAELHAYYRKVLQTELAEEHLDKCGLDYDRSTRNAAEKVIPMFLALHALMTGEVPESDEDKKAVRDVMGGGTVAVLRKALTADLRLRIYSDAGSVDPNSQWFNAQRVACRATGVGSIRVEGTLDPEKGDSTDWWIIEKWEPGSIQFSTSADGGVQFDPPKVEEGSARLRIAAGQKASRYWFEMRAERGGDLNVVVYESHIPGESKFPY